MTVTSQDVTRKEMGLGDLIKDPDLVFAREFRWVLKSAHFKEYIVKSINIDHCKNCLEIDLYDVRTTEGFQALKWLTDLKEGKLDRNKEELLLTTYDGMGNPLYSTKFKGLSLFEHTTKLDYSSSEIITRKTKFTYCSEETFVHEPPKPPKDVPPPVTSFEERANSFEEKINAMTQRAALKKRGLQCRPIKFDSTRIDFLNSNCFLPGREIK